MSIAKRVKRFAVSVAIAALAATPIVAPAASASGPVASASITLHSGEFCTKSKQALYHRHGYTCRRASDGRLRLFTW
jgi:hypothetical protein